MTPVTYRCTRCGFEHTPPARARVIEVRHRCHPSGRSVPMIPVDHKGDGSTQMQKEADT